MKFAVVALALALLLTGCAGPGPLEDGRWFLPYTGLSNPFVILLRSVANVGLTSVYVAACAARLFQSRAAYWERQEHEHQLSKSLP